MRTKALDAKDCELIATEIFDLLISCDRAGVPISVQLAAIGSVITGMIAENYPRSEWLKLAEFFNETSLGAIRRRLNEDDEA